MKRHIIVLLTLLLVFLCSFVACSSSPSAHDLIYDTYYDWSINEELFVFQAERYRVMNVDLLTHECMDTFSITSKDVILLWEDETCYIMPGKEKTGTLTYYILESSEYQDIILLIPEDDSSIFPLGNFDRPLGYALQKCILSDTEDGAN